MPTRAGEQEIRAIEHVYGGSNLVEKDFSREFLNAVPYAQVEAIARQLSEAYGAIVSIEERGDGYMIETATHRIPVRIALNGDGQIASLLFRPAEVLTASIEQTVEKIATLPGNVSVLVTSDGETVFSSQADKPLAVGSAFKLGVLKALIDDIDAGRRGWDDIVRLEQADISLPSGRLQAFPPGSPLTLHTLAALMISESDNTATDMLMRAVGRKKVGEALGIEIPLTTREFFVLKANPDLAERYRNLAAGEDAEDLLAEIGSRDLPSVGDATGLHQPGIEWNVSASRLCALITGVQNADVFSINPGPVETADWRSVAYKGGSETGVLNFTAALEGKDGSRHCAVMTINAEETIDLNTASGLFARLTAQLAD